MLSIDFLYLSRRCFSCEQTTASLRSNQHHPDAVLITTVIQAAFAAPTLSPMISNKE